MSEPVVVFLDETLARDLDGTLDNERALAAQDGDQARVASVRTIRRALRSQHGVGAGEYLLSRAEWRLAIEILTRFGRSCTEPAEAEEAEDYWRVAAAIASGLG